MESIPEDGLDVKAVRKSSAVVGEGDDVAGQEVDHRGQVLLQVDDKIGVKLGKCAKYENIIDN